MLVWATEATTITVREVGTRMGEVFAHVSALFRKARFGRGRWFRSKRAELLQHEADALADLHDMSHS
jgi:hypothetical protein